ncbi:electron transfer flavoprotein subunit alpha/FixB family protein [Tepidibacter hydrothermalis]|uniref:Electron transfer flavoprotein subunit alpha/FixB family protein n=1 Tax=Tepidibacter hydrothermalis TaxID=3036126 RepID=A0ABY8ECD3_9FIRM|nr:electron transfer flavoprotein subunit alpha/FixB family protein [Tepidibacter hydrothermalis]WFD09565.1 electron transfer flavoprotein subunit alpha/FixB family protein [Tepidibacter hydrothermalis]
MNNVKHEGVLVYIEQRESEIQNVSLELLGKGRELADKLNVKLSAAIIGSDIKNVEILNHYGADNVIVVEDKKFEYYITKTYAKALTSIINTENPEIVLIGATSIGRDIAPRVSARIKTGLTADCTSLDIDEEDNNLLMTRPAFGGNIMATITCSEHRPQMATVRPGVMKKFVKDENRESVIKYHSVDINENDMDVEVLEVVKEEDKKISIEDAKILVSGGRGVGNKENLSVLSELADLLKAEVSGSRAVIDEGLLEKDRQVGQTGKTVRPDVYFACGISGAIQHIAGMEDSDFIIAINKNKEAAIFDVADLGIVCDLNKVIPCLIEEIKSHKLKA